MSVAFQAQFAGWCRACDEPIKVNQHVVYTNANSPLGPDMLVHVKCPEPKPPEPVCLKCNMIHAGGCW